MVIEIKERSTTTRLAAASYDGSSSVAHTHTPRQQTSPSVRLVVSWRAWSVVITLSPPWVGDRWSFQYVLWCALCVRACLNWTLVGRAHPVSSWLQCRVARRRRRGNAAPALLGAVAFSLSRRTSRAEQRGSSAHATAIHRVSRRRREPRPPCCGHGSPKATSRFGSAGVVQEITK
jgi:hypothetical protein